MKIIHSDVVHAPKKLGDMERGAGFIRDCGTETFVKLYNHTVMDLVVVVDLSNCSLMSLRAGEFVYPKNFTVEF